MTATALSLTDLNKSFGAAHIIRGVNLDVRAGERHAIIGPNGAGKSSLFNLISGNFRPSSGDIRLNGVSIAGKRPDVINRQGLARSFQITSVFSRLSVFENIRLGVLGRHRYRFNLLHFASRLQDINREADQYLEKLRLQRVRDQPAGLVAYSDQRALEIGMTLASGASVLLLDEPMAGMSREETTYTIDLVREVTAGKTLLIVEHDMDVVFSLCDRVSVLVYGQIVATGTPDEIRANTSVQDAYLGHELGSEAAT